MPLQDVIRNGDLGSHGGTVTATSTSVFIGGQGVAHDDSIYHCVTHGPQGILPTSDNVRIGGKLVARHGDPTTCGAVLWSSQSAVKSK